MNIYRILPIYDQIAHPVGFIDLQWVDCMHSDFNGCLEHEKVGAGKAGGKM